MKADICIKCKGIKMLCGKPKCPRLERAAILNKLKQRIGKEIDGITPSIFIGSVGYPRVLTGPMVSPFERENIDAPERWYGTPLEDIVEMRYLLVRTKKPLGINSAKNPSRELQEMQDIAMSVKHVDTEVTLYRKPLIDTSFSAVTPPWGSSAYVKTFRLTNNPKIPRRVDAIVSDELNANEQILMLYNELPVSHISKIFSVGLLGIDKKLVPTRWSITATDDTIGKALIGQIKQYDEIDDYMLFTSTYLGNHFEILLVPGKWCFENIECYVPGNIWVDPDEHMHFVSDWEPYEGRKTYADNVLGAYYAARLAVLEYLKRVKRQACAIVLREITPDYWAPVGVWQIRENVRAAMNSNPQKLHTLDDSLNEISQRMYGKNQWQRYSVLVSRFRSREIMRKYLA